MAGGCLSGTVEELGAYVAGLDPDALSGDDAAALTELFARGERLCATGKAMAAKRAVECRQHARAGERSGGEWLAKLTGGERREAEEALETAGQMGACSELDAACRRGEMSARQAGEVAKAAKADPSSAPSLVAKAKSASLSELKEASKAVRNAAASRRDDSQRLAAIHRSRHLRTWVDDDGAGRISARVTPDHLAQFKAFLQPFAQRAFERARTAGGREASECYAADGLIDMAAAASAGPAARDVTRRHRCDCGPRDVGDTPEGGAGEEPDAGPPRPTETPPDPPQPTETPPGPPATVVVLIDLQAFRRGCAQGGETCEIDGLGSVPVSAATALMTDAFVAAVLQDGVDIRKVVHLGRNVTAAQRTALLARDRVCVVPGCGQTKGLEIDHVSGWAATHHTVLDELARICSHHHDQKTYEGWTLTGRPGAWQWLPPPGGPLPGPFDDDGVDLHPPPALFAPSP
jgi:hypothetical protein